MERHGEHGRHEVLQVVEKSSTGRLAEISNIAVWVAEQPAISKVAIVWVQGLRIRCCWRSRASCRVAAIELSKHVCGVVWCYRLETLLERSTAPPEAFNFTFESALVRLWCGVFACR